MLLNLWVEQPYRMTRDLDLLGSGEADVTIMIERMARVCRTEVVDDAVVFYPDDIAGAPIYQLQVL